MLNPLKLLDPDTEVWAFDKLQHYGLGGIGSMLYLHDLLGLSIGMSFILSATIAVIWEGGQTDVAYSRRFSPDPLLGRAGYGFGLLDIAAHLVGSLTYILVRAIVILL